MTISAQSSEYRVNRSVLNSGRRAQTKLDRRGVDMGHRNLSIIEVKEQAKMSTSQRCSLSMFPRLEEAQPVFKNSSIFRHDASSTLSKDHTDSQH